VSARTGRYSRRRNCSGIEEGPVEKWLQRGGISEVTVREGETLKIKPDLSVTLAGIHLRNPVMTASGTFGYGKEFAAYMNLENIGALVTKGLSLKPKAGNPMPRIVETPGGMLNAIGLQNVGIDAFVSEKLPFLRTVKTPVIVNFFGNTLEEYEELAARLDGLPEVAGMEINISCPNVKHGGIVFGTDPEAAYSVVKAVRCATIKPVIVKLSPNVTDIGRDGGSLCRCRRRCAVADKYRYRDGHRPEEPAAVSGQLHGRSVRSGNQAHSAADGLAGLEVGQAARDRHRGDYLCDGCAGIHAGRRHGSPGGDRELHGA